MSLAGFLNPIKVGGSPISIMNAPAMPKAPEPVAPGRRCVRALEQVDKELARLARFEAAAAAKHLELADLQRRSGDEVLAADGTDAEAVVADRLRVQLRDLQAALDLDERTVTACRGKVAGARLEALEANLADVIEGLAQAVAAKAKHDERLAQLLAAVKAHDGAVYEARGPLDLGPGVALEAQSWIPSRSAMLADEVREWQTRVRILEAAVNGLPLPTQEFGMPILPHLFSPLVKGPQAILETVG